MLKNNKDKDKDKDKDFFCSFYTKSEQITDYMIKKIDLKNGDNILEPSAGDGVFIENILKQERDIENLSIEVVDMDIKAIEILKEKFGNISDHNSNPKSKFNVRVRKADTLIDDEFDKINPVSGFYDKIIGNPPYGAWQDYEKRDFLKKKYKGHYVKETYSLFLLRCLSLLKPKGKLCFIVPDTFLFLKMHTNLRKELLTKTKIEEILIFPSKFFPQVNFGYSDLSIITLEKIDEGDRRWRNNTVRVIKGFKNVDELEILSKGEKIDHLNYFFLNQKEILEQTKDHVFILSFSPLKAKKLDLKTCLDDEDGKDDQVNESKSNFELEKRLKEILLNTEKTFGDISNVVTGLYTGDNKKFIKVLDNNVKNSKGYEIIKSNEVFNYDKLYVDNKNNLLDLGSLGLDLDLILGLKNNEGDKKKYIPYIKSASDDKYFRNLDEWFVKWDRQTINHYKNDPTKKARFQNSSFYFKKGVGVPMVKPKKSSIKAFLMENRVFDQSIVGVFPKEKEEDKIYYLLALLNSDLINVFIHMINPTANNSANYIKKIPYIDPTKEQLKKINEKVLKIRELNLNLNSSKGAGDLKNKENHLAFKLKHKLHNEINKIINSIYGI